MEYFVECEFVAYNDFWAGRKTRFPAMKSMSEAVTEAEYRRDLLHDMGEYAGKPVYKNVQILTCIAEFRHITIE